MTETKIDNATPPATAPVEIKPGEWIVPTPEGAGPAPVIEGIVGDVRGYGGKGWTNVPSSSEVKS